MKRAPAPCALHPRYQGLRAPRSKKPECTCRKVYDYFRSAK